MVPGEVVGSICGTLNRSMCQTRLSTIPNIAVNGWVSEWTTGWSLVSPRFFMTQFRDGWIRSRSCWQYKALGKCWRTSSCHWKRRGKPATSEGSELSTATLFNHKAPWYHSNPLTSGTILQLYMCGNTYMHHRPTCNILCTHILYSCRHMYISMYDMYGMIYKPFSGKMVFSNQIGVFK